MLLALKWDSVRDRWTRIAIISRERELKNPNDCNIQKIMFTLENELEKVNLSMMK